MTKHSHECNFSLFWDTSLVCDLDQGYSGSMQEDNKCQVEVPIYDQLLDLMTLHSDIPYEVHSGMLKSQISLEIG